VRRDIPQRIQWAVDELDVRPGDRILEIGCGPGVAAALICERLDDGGHLTAIDRSAVAIERARKRNEDHIAAGRLTLEQVELKDLAAEAGQFDKVFAVNVNVFWTQPDGPERAIVAGVLAPGGRARAFYEGPDGRRSILELP
jgi:SAM-dependent methyltransferase